MVGAADGALEGVTVGAAEGTLDPLLTAGILDVGTGVGELAFLALVRVVGELVVPTGYS